ncbi:hypothetical protein SSCG_03180 [Streptomyces clavuligerus]|nr:hypothetical protein SSCG_03180 [Streptomyces clavuligerus]
MPVVAVHIPAGCCRPTRGRPRVSPPRRGAASGHRGPQRTPRPQRVFLNCTSSALRT